MPVPRRFCLRGHDTQRYGRTRSRNCNECYRQSRREARQLRPPPPPLPDPPWSSGVDYPSRRFGDYFAVENERGLLDYPVPNGSSLHGWPASGYGWPEDEYPVILVARILGAPAPNVW